ncbi:hypothetical protein IB211_02130c [Intestinimonas butyriciproducens]|uniref:Uncharacterized protein n=1 Tax=Intestinimonas butyriciproducens TaxID=1297617 RepID=A0A0S2W5B3_9FIRM|nr:hypothetical protein IB211_02130c [Intestinimonas butyriciproducens]
MPQHRLTVYQSKRNTAPFRRIFLAKEILRLYNETYGAVKPWC